MSYDIITYCSESYKKCLYFAIESWTQTKCRKIIVYTDGWSRDFGDRVEFRKLFPKEVNWTVNVGRKLFAVLDYVNGDWTDFALFDCDNYVVRDFSEVFDTDKFLGVTRFDQKGKTCTAGNAFFKKNDETIEFLKDWKVKQENMWSSKEWDSDPHLSYDQLSFDWLVRKQYIDKVQLLPDKYNCERDKIEDWIKRIKSDTVVILHFKDSRWKDKVLIDRILSSLHPEKIDTRIDMLKLLPKGLVIAELGVFCGDFSNEILSVMCPKELHLIDLWRGRIESGDVNGNNKRVIEDMGLVYVELERKYKDSNIVKLHKGDSIEVINSFADESIDAVYIDSAHKYDRVKGELEISRKKVRKGGYILGHDYAPHMKGVVNAVDEFCKKYRYRIVYLTKERCGSYWIRNG